MNDDDDELGGWVEATTWENFTPSERHWLKASWRLDTLIDIALDACLPMNVSSVDDAERQLTVVLAAVLDRRAQEDDLGPSGGDWLRVRYRDVALAATDAIPLPALNEGPRAARRRTR